MARKSGDSSVMKENDPNNKMAATAVEQDSKEALGSSCKKRKVNDMSNANLSSGNGGETTNDVQSVSNNNRNNINDAPPPPPKKSWEELYKELAAERVTKPEQLYYAYLRESEEREKLMRSYNQDLENDNKKYKSQLTNHTEQKQTIQEQKNQLAELESSCSNQSATIQAFQQLTGATLSNVVAQVNNNNNEEALLREIGYDCTVENQNPDSKARTKFRISVVPTTGSATADSSQQKEKETSHAEANSRSSTLLKYQPLENPKPLPDFLHEEIEFESSELPPLLQNILRGIFPEE